MILSTTFGKFPICYLLMRCGINNITGDYYMHECKDDDNGITILERITYLGFANF